MIFIMAKKHEHYIINWGGGDYSDCNVDDCPYLSMGTINDHLIEIDDIPEYPSSLMLGHEEVCNYRCTFCNSRRDADKDAETLNKYYDNIYENLKPVLPHIKHISAHGRGEVFTARHVMKILSEWRPVAPVEECRASLETNGSLFDAEHWKQIENLGQYNLRVAITVTSFDEYTYQLLSGTKLPVSQIINNLHFVKSLREKGIINHLEIATVVQERNFFQMPEFTRRCIEEFGADSVRLRPYVIQTNGNFLRNWFTDVRCTYHPYHEEYKKVMQDPIFKNPKVLDWSGGRDSQVQDLLPFLMRKNKWRSLKVMASGLAEVPSWIAKKIAKRIMR